MIVLVESTPTIRLCSDPNPRLGFYLLGFPKPVRFEPKHYTRTIPLCFPRSKRESIGGTPIGRAFPAKTATEEPHQLPLKCYDHDFILIGLKNRINKPFSNPNKVIANECFPFQPQDSYTHIIIRQFHTFPEFASCT